jgi:predicted transcriptional regulator
MTVAAGQTWKLWVFGHSYEETLEIEEVREDGIVRGKRADGGRFVTTVKRLEEDGGRVQ